MSLCKNCNCQLTDGDTHCRYCGSKIELEENPSETPVKETATPKKKFGIGKIIIAIVAVFIGKFAGQLTTEFLNGGFSENREMKKIDQFISEVSEYTPGYCEEDSYFSSNIGLKFTADEHWYMYTEEELIPFTEQVRSSALASMNAAMYNMDISEKIRNKLIEAVYAKTEMGAYCVIDDYIVGEATIGVFSTYGMKEQDPEIFADEYMVDLKNKLSTSADKITTGKETLAGKTYHTIDLYLTADGMDLHNRMYVKIGDNMIYMIACKAVAEYDDEVFRSFNECISKY